MHHSTPHKELTSSTRQPRSTVLRPPLIYCNQAATVAARSTTDITWLEQQHRKKTEILKICPFRLEWGRVTSLPPGDAAPDAAPNRSQYNLQLAPPASATACSYAVNVTHKQRTSNKPCRSEKQIACIQLRHTAHTASHCIQSSRRAHRLMHG